MSERYESSAAPPLSGRNRLLLLAVALIGAALFTTLWMNLEGAERLRLDEESRITAEQVRLRLEAWIDFRASALTYAVDAASPAGGVDADSFRRHAAQLMALHPGFQAVNWVDAEGVIRIIVPERGNEPALGADLDLHPEKDVRTSVARARTSSSITRTQVIELLQGGQGLATYLPVRDAQGRLEGFVNGVFRIQTLVGACLAEPRIRQDFRYVLSEEEGRVAYAHEGGADAPSWRHRTVRSVRVVDAPWRLALAPSPARIAEVETVADETLLAAGLLGTALIVWLLRAHLLRREALRRSEALHRSLITDVVDASRVGIIILDAQRRVVWANHAFETYFGLVRDTLLGQDIRRVARDGLKAGLVRRPEEFTRRVFTPPMDADRPYEFHVLPGERRRERWLEHRSQAIEAGLFAGGRIDHFYDVTRRKGAEAEQSRLLAAMEQSTETVIITDAQGAIEYVNPAFEQVTGYTRKEVLGATPRILKSGVQDDRFYRDLWETITSGRTWEGTFTNRRKDGTLYQAIATISPVCDTRGRIVNFVSVKRDVTRELDLESQLRQAQKMEAVGKLAGGVAHDFNNLLQVILGRSHLLLDLAPPGSRRADAAHMIVEASEKAAGLTRQLLAFGRRQHLERRIVSPNQLVSDHLRMLRRLIGEDVELEVALGDTVGLVRSDPTQIEQVLMNLCVNAREAMPAGGRITIATDEELREAVLADGAPVAENPVAYVRISVTDTGVGIAAEHVERVFEPFFSTKEPGQGSGLGLSTVYGIVHQHDGFVEIQSRPGQGTRVEVFLPVAEGVPFGSETEADEDVAQGTETILVVEDEAPVRSLVVETLEDAGYTVRQAADGKEALRILEDADGAIDLLFTDVVMPRMGGRALVEAARANAADLRVLLTSGYGPDGLRDGDGLEFLAKPYSPHVMLRRIREVLDT